MTIHDSRLKMLQIFTKLDRFQTLLATTKRIDGKYTTEAR